MSSLLRFKILISKFGAVINKSLSQNNIKQQIKPPFTSKQTLNNICNKHIKQKTTQISSTPELSN